MSELEKNIDQVKELMDGSESNDNSSQEHESSNPLKDLDRSEKGQKVGEEKVSEDKEEKIKQLEEIDATEPDNNEEEESSKLDGLESRLGVLESGAKKSLNNVKGILHREKEEPADENREDKETNEELEGSEESKGSGKDRITFDDIETTSSSSEDLEPSEHEALAENIETSYSGEDSEEFLEESSEIKEELNELESKAEKQHEEKDNGYEEFEENFESLEERMDRLESKLGLEEKVELLESKIEDNKTHEEALVERLEDAEKDIEDLKALQDLATIVSEVEDQLESFSKRGEEKREELHEDIESVKEQVENNKSRVEEDSEKLDKLAEELEKTRESLDRDLVEQKDIEEIKNNYSKAERVEELSNNIEALENNLSEEERVDSLEEKAQGHARELEKLKNEVDEVQGEHTDLRDAVGLLVENEEASNEELSNQIRELKNMIDQHQEAISYLMTNMADLSEAVKEEMNSSDTVEHRDFMENQFKAG